MAEKMSKAAWDARRKARLDAASKLPTTGTLTLRIGDVEISTPVDLRDFSSGSRGYFGQVRGVVGDVPLGGTFNAIVSGTAPYKVK